MRVPVRGTEVPTTKKDYFALADEPEQDKWFQRVHETLASDPQWNDGEIVWSFTG